MPEMTSHPGRIIVGMRSLTTISKPNKQLILSSFTGFHKLDLGSRSTARDFTLATPIVRTVEIDDGVAPLATDTHFGPLLFPAILSPGQTSVRSNDTWLIRRDWTRDGSSAPQQLSPVAECHPGRVVFLFFHYLEFYFHFGCKSSASFLISRLAYRHVK